MNQIETREQQKLNWKADGLEGMFYQCYDCEHISEEEVSKHYGSDEYEESLPCKCKECKYITEYNNILKLIKARTQAL